MNRQRKAKVLIRLLEEEELELECIYERVKVSFNINASREEAAHKTRAMMRLNDARKSVETAIAELNVIAQRSHLRSNSEELG